jgi:hypothetical protein
MDRDFVKARQSISQQLTDFVSLTSNRWMSHSPMHGTEVDPWKLLDGARTENGQLAQEIAALREELARLSYELAYAHDTAEHYRRNARCRDCREHFSE